MDSEMPVVMMTEA